MRPTPSPRMNVVRKEEKEARLKEFILKNISERAGQAAATGSDARYQLIALSAESPVAKALASLKDELSAAGIGVDMLVVRTGAVSGCGSAITADGHNSLRSLADARLLDAHEQLVLGAETVWIGDCMRRDPAKRDAYECYAEGSVEIAAWALRSFERLWAQAEPAVISTEAQPQQPALPMSVLDPLLAAISDAQPVLAATRH